jgi:uncharacterized protein
VKLPAPRPATLEASIGAFCTVLRQEHGFALGPGELNLALQAVRAVGIGQPARFRHALQAVCCGRAEQLPVFALAFDRHFLTAAGARPTRQDEQPPMNFGWDAPPAEAVPEDDLDEQKTKDRQTASRSLQADHQPGHDEPESSSAPGPSHHNPEADASEDAPGQQAVRAQASGQHGSDAAPDLDGLPADFRQAARSFLRHLKLRPARRWKPAVRGTRLDFRRTLRSALATEGEPLRLRWRGRPPHTATVVLLLDASRSMDDHARTALAFAAALTRCSRRVHTFSFSTGLEDLTQPLNALALKPTTVVQTLPPLHAAWGGGTRIGASLLTFLREHGDRLLGGQTLVLVVSDALEVGDTAPLAQAARELAHRSAALVWLNPLAASAQFQPTSRGMAAVFPHLTLLTHADSAAEYAALRVR